MASSSHTYGADLAFSVLLNPNLDKAGATYLQTLLALEFHLACRAKNFVTHEVAA